MIIIIQNYDEMVSIATNITGMTFVFTFHIRSIYIVRSLYFRIFSTPFLNTFLSPEIATSINVHVTFSLSRIIMSGFCERCFCQFSLVDSIIWLPYLQVLFLLISVHAGTSVHCLILLLFPCVY
jgi:hypothetical protein